MIAPWAFFLLAAGVFVLGLGTMLPGQLSFVCRLLGTVAAGVAAFCLALLLP